MAPADTILDNCSVTLSTFQKAREWVHVAEIIGERKNLPGKGIWENGKRFPSFPKFQKKRYFSQLSATKTLPEEILTAE